VRFRVGGRISTLVTDSIVELPTLSKNNLQNPANMPITVIVGSDSGTLWSCSRGLDIPRLDLRLACISNTVVAVLKR
jgi:hypothetical protein